MNKQLSFRLFQVIFIVLVALLIGYALGSHRLTSRFGSTRTASFGNDQNLDMSQFYEVLDRVKSDYYDKKKVDPQKIVNGAVSGMLQSLDDPYTSYFPPKQNSSFKEQMAGEFQGIGAELSLNDSNQIMVVSPLEGSPAKAAGIKTGDIIAAVNGVETNGWTLPQAVDKIRGPKGSTVTLAVLHDKDKQLTDVKITRDVITIKSVDGWVKTMNCSSGGECSETTASCPTCKTIAYIRLSQFGDKTNNEWVETVNNEISKIDGQKVDAVILDLRNNPGGYLQDAVFIASEFIPSGTVVIQQDGKGVQTPLTVSRSGQMIDGSKYPLYVLINKGSASASEIVAGALRDHNRAKLVGETSFGKGTVQQAIDLGDGASVHLSVAKWLTPNQTWVHKKGLKPDISIPFDATSSGKMKIDNQLNTLIQKI